jgi:hypothetical protein
VPWDLEAKAAEAILILQEAFQQENQHG